jgi:hypothetical protein
MSQTAAAEKRAHVQHERPSTDWYRRAGANVVAVAVIFLTTSVGLMILAFVTAADTPWDEWWWLPTGGLVVGATVFAAVGLTRAVHGETSNGEAQQPATDTKGNGRSTTNSKNEDQRRRDQRAALGSTLLAVGILLLALSPVLLIVDYATDDTPSPTPTPSSATATPAATAEPGGEGVDGAWNREDVTDGSSRQEGRAL